MLGMFEHAQFDVLHRTMSVNIRRLALSDLFYLLHISS